VIYLNDLMKTDVFENIKCIVFDCDGVLIDSIEANTAYYNMVKEHFGLPPMDEKEKAFAHSATMADAMRHILPEKHWNEAFDYQKKFDYARVMPYIKRMEGVFELIWWLRGAGCQLAINTSRKDTMPMVLESIDLQDTFFPVITVNEVRKPKPHPEGMYQIMSTLDLRPEETVFIGDSIVDCQAARNAGTRIWSYRNEMMDADLYIPDYWALKRGLMRLYEGPVISF
jgi:HAD superfamily hydrolase (TIGR01509 family)